MSIQIDETLYRKIRETEWKINVIKKREAGPEEVTGGR